VNLRSKFSVLLNVINNIARKIIYTFFKAKNVTIGLNGVLFFVKKKLKMIIQCFFVILYAYNMLTQV
jgi:hypothetical protein